MNLSLSRPASASSSHGKQQPLLSCIHEFRRVLRKQKNQSLAVEEALLRVMEEIANYTGTTDDTIQKRLTHLGKERDRLRGAMEEGRNKVVVLQKYVQTISKYPKADVLPPCQFIECISPGFTCILSAVETEDGFLEFSNRYPLAGKRNMHTRFYIRECYRVIFSQLVIANEEVFVDRYMIQGTPGVGKSSFLLYAFWRFVQMKKSVIFFCGCHRIYFDANKFWNCVGDVFDETQKDPSGRDLWTSQLFCLFDAHNQDRIPTIYLNCQFILVTSPKRDLVNDFKKTVHLKNRFYLPVWRIGEMERIEALYDSPADWREICELVGGVPRIVFDNADTYENAYSRIRIAAKFSDFKTLSNLTTESVVHEKSYVHSLVHIHADPPYRIATMTFSSRVAMSLVFTYHLNNVKARWHEVLHTDVGGALEGVFIGDIFEIVAIDIILAGGEFNHCRLRINKAPEDMGKLILPKSETRRSTCVEYSGDPNVLYVPISPSFPGLDAWMYEVGGFQVTINLRHDMNERLITDLPKLGAGAHKLFWVLRSHEYKRFKARKHMTKDFNYPELEQYAIEMPDSMISMVDRALEQIREHYENPGSDDDC